MFLALALILFFTSPVFGAGISAPPPGAVTGIGSLTDTFVPRSNGSTLVDSNLSQSAAGEMSVGSDATPVNDNTFQTFTDVVATDSAQYIANKMTVSIEPPSASSVWEVIGFQTTLNTNDENAADIIVMAGNATLTGGNTVSTLSAVQGFAAANAAAQTVTGRLSGLTGQAWVSGGGGTVGDLSGAFAQALTFAGTATDVVGLDIITGIGTSSTVTNRYGLRIDIDSFVETGSPSGDDFAIYSLMTQMSHFEGGMRLDGATGGCLMFRDSDDAGYSECEALDGTLSCATDADGICDGTL